MPAVKLPPVPDISSDPRLAAAKDRHDQLSHQLAAAERQEAELLQSRIRRIPPIEAAAELLTSDSEGGTAVAAPAETLAEVRVRIATLREAKIRQAKILERIAGEVSREVAAGLLPAHRDIVGRVATAVAEFEAAHQSLVEFHDKLRAAGLTGYSGTLRNLCLPEEITESVAGFRSEAAEFGYLKGAK